MDLARSAEVVGLAFASLRGAVVPWSRERRRASAASEPTAVGTIGDDAPADALELWVTARWTS